MDPPVLDDPPPEAYGRVTNPERYLVLHDRADELVASLEVIYQVDRTDGTEVAPDLPGRPILRAVRLTPTSADGGVLTLSFTDFPGVVLSFGGGYQRSFPGCGCDACNEDPEALGDELWMTAEALVGGTFWEGIEGDYYCIRLGGIDYRLGTTSGRTLMAEDDPLRSLPPSRQWAPWTRR